MPSLLSLGIIWLHLIAAIVWLGGLVFQVCVVFPTLGRMTPLSERVRLALGLEARFRVVMWPAVGLVLFTGLVNLMHTWYAMSMLGMQVSVMFGWVLASKVLLIAVMLVLQVIQQFVLQPRRLVALQGVATHAAMPEGLYRLQRLAVVLYSVVLGLGLGVLWCGVMLRAV